MRASDRVKTDRLDSIKLVEYYQQGMLRIVHAIDEAAEGHRRLLRGRAQLVDLCKITKRQILSACRCFGISYRSSTGVQSYWTKGHRAFLNGLLSDESIDECLREDLENKRYVLGTHEEVIKRDDERIHQLAVSERYRQAVGYLCCIRGIAELIAMTLLVEIGDIHRFAKPSKLTSYAGLSINEYSSGGKCRKSPITALGNK